MQAAVYQRFAVFYPDGTPLELHFVRTVDETYPNRRSEKEPFNFKSDEKDNCNDGSFAADGWRSDGLRPAARKERGDRSFAAPAADTQEKSAADDAAKTDSTAGESAKEESKVESEGSSEGNSSSASEAPASSAE
ncbi:MAG: hypothetical protein ACLRSE_04585 [Alistipes finegoldii]